jgi:peroxiredoxin
MRKALALIALTLPSLVAANVPRPAPDFVVNMNNGAPIRLSQYKGKVVAFIFILTTCPHCQKCITYLIKNQDEFGPRGFQVLAAAIDQGAASLVPNFVNSFKPLFPVGYSDDTNQVLTFMEHPVMLIPRMPLLSFIDRQGQIRAQFEGDNKFLDEASMEKNLRDQIEALLKEGGAPAKKSGPKKSK